MPVLPTTEPVAAGVCEEQVGGVFLTTVHVCEADVVPLLTVATSVLLPVFRSDEAMVFVLDLPPDIGLPFNVQVVEQLASLGVTVNTVFVPADAATRYGVVEGEDAVIAQDDSTATFHEHTVLS